MMFSPAMRITQVMLAKNFGGMERYFVDLCQELADRGHQVQAICHQHFSHQSLLEGRENLLVSPVTAMGNWDILAKHRIRQLIKTFSPDVIETHLSRATALTSAAAVSLAIPLVSKTHNYLKLKYYHQVSHFIAATKDQKHYLLGNNIPETCISVIPNFSTMEPSTQQKTVTSGPVRFLAYGRFVTKKGFEILLPAFHRYLNDGHDGILTLGGDGPNRESLNKICVALNIQDRVNFAGWIDNTAKALDDADIFILPSLDEPFGIVVLEAMARGTPIISTRTKGPVEILDNQSACLVAINSADELAGAMAHAATQYQDMLSRAATASGKYTSTYHADAVIPKIVSLYRQVINSNA